MSKRRQERPSERAARVANEKLQAERDAHGGETPAERAMRLSADKRQRSRRHQKDCLTERKVATVFKSLKAESPRISLKRITAKRGRQTLLHEIKHGQRDSRHFNAFPWSCHRYPFALKGEGGELTIQLRLRDIDSETQEETSPSYVVSLHDEAVVDFLEFMEQGVKPWLLEVWSNTIGRAAKEAGVPVTPPETTAELIKALKAREC